MNSHCCRSMQTGKECSNSTVGDKCAGGGPFVIIVDSDSAFLVVEDVEVEVEVGAVVVVENVDGMEEEVG